MNMRASGEHFDQVIVKIVIELSLEIPFETLCIKFPGPEHDSIRIIPDSGLLESD